MTARPPLRARRPSGASGESGLTMVEVLVAVAILCFGVLSSLAIFFAAGRFAGDAARGSTACRLASAVLDYASAYPEWAILNPKSGDSPDPFVTPADGLVWKLDAKKDPSDGADPSLANVWILKLRIAEDSNDNATYELMDWLENPIRPRGFIKSGNMDCTCETYVYKK